MPIYVYRCRSCGERTEALQKSSDAPRVDCPVCGAPELYRIIAPAGVIFRGTGFHVTDYSRGGGRKGRSSESKGGESKSSESKGGESKSSDSKGDSSPPGAAERVA